MLACYPIIAFVLTFVLTCFYVFYVSLIVWMASSKLHSILLKKWSFPLRISSVNVDLVTAYLVRFTEEILHGKLHFLYCAMISRLIYCLEALPKQHEYTLANVVSSDRIVSRLQYRKISLYLDWDAIQYLT